MAQTETVYYQNTQKEAQTFFNTYKKQGLLSRLSGVSSDTKAQQQQYKNLVEKGGVDISDVHPAHFIKALVDMQMPMGMGWMSHLQNGQMIPYTVEKAINRIENPQENHDGSKEVYLDYENGKRIKSSIVIFPELKKAVFMQGEYGYETDTNLACSIVETLKEGKALSLPGAADLITALFNDQVINIDPMQKLQIGAALSEKSGLTQPTLQQTKETLGKYSYKREAYEQKQEGRLNRVAPQNPRGGTERF